MFLFLFGNIYIERGVYGKKKKIAMFEYCANLAAVDEGDQICYECRQPVMPISDYTPTDEYLKCDAINTKRNVQSSSSASSHCVHQWSHGSYKVLRPVSPENVKLQDLVKLLENAVTDIFDGIFFIHECREVNGDGCFCTSKKNFGILIFDVSTFFI